MVDPRCHVLEGMDAQFLSSLAVFLQIIDEESFIGIDVRQLDYLFIDVGIRLSQMHSLREETVLEIILYPMVLIREEMLHAIIPMHIDGITQEEETMASSTFFALPRMPTSTGMILPISAASMSMWMTLA